MKNMQRTGSSKQPPPPTKSTPKPSQQPVPKPVPKPAPAPVPAPVPAPMVHVDEEHLQLAPQHAFRKENNFKWMRFFAEFIGSFAITFVIVATNALYENLQANNVSDHLVSETGAILARTFVYACFYAAFRYVSGAHFNPGVTLAYMMLFEITTVVGILYILIQLIGGILGGLLVWGIWYQNIEGPMLNPGALICDNCTTPFAPGDGRGFLIELIGSGAVILIFTLIDHSRTAGKSGYLAIGLVYGAFGFALNAFTGAFFNPAVALGAAVASTEYDWNDNRFWIFIIAPIVAAVVDTLIYGLAFQLPGDGCGPHLQFFSNKNKKIHFVIE